MKIAIPCTNQDEVFEHFGHAQQFAIYEAVDESYVDRKVFETKVKGHDQIAQLMRYLNVNIVVCSGIGAGALETLSRYGISVYGGAKGNIDDVYYSFMDNELECISKPTCTTHGHNHGCSCHSHAEGVCNCGCCH